MAPGPRRALVRGAPADELGVRPEVDRCVECDRMLEADERFRWVPPLGGVLCERCPGPPHERTGLSLEALKLLKAYQRLDIEAHRRAAAERRGRARGRGRPARVHARRPRARGRARWRSSTRSATASARGVGARVDWPTVELRDIVTDGRIARRRSPLRAARARSGSWRSVETSFAGRRATSRAVPPDVGGPRRRPASSGFVDDQRRHPRGALAADPSCRAVLPVAPPDRRARPAPRLRHGRPRRRRGLPRGAPGADMLWTSAGQGRGSPQPFYERYGFVPTDRFLEGERVMRLDLHKEPR